MTAKEARNTESRAARMLSTARASRTKTRFVPVARQLTVCVLCERERLRRDDKKRTNTAAIRHFANANYQSIAALRQSAGSHPQDLLGGCFGVYRHTSHEA